MTDERLGSLESILGSAPEQGRPARPPAPTDRAESKRPPHRRSDGRSDERHRTPSTKLPSRRPARAQDRSATSDRTRIPVRLQPTLHEALQRKARAQGVPLSAVVFEAIEAAYDVGELATVVDRGDNDRAGSLFSRPAARAATPKVTVEFRMSRGDRETLDRLVADHDTTRSRLITGALERHLRA